MTSFAFALALTSAVVAPKPDLALEFQGVRSMAMGGAHRAVGSSNDTLMINPAGMAVTKRYAFELQYGYAPFDGLSHFNISAVDSQSGPVAAGIGYTHDRSDVDGKNVSLHRIYLGAAYPITPNIGFGVTSRYLRGGYLDVNDVRQDVSQYSNDLGLSYLSDMGFSVAVSYQNLIRTKQADLLPPSVGVGLGFNGNRFTLAGDFIVDLRDNEPRRFSYLAGAEYLLFKSVVVRGGYGRRPYRGVAGFEGDENKVTGGLGFLSTAFAMDVSYGHSITRRTNWELIGALKLFL